MTHRLAALFAGFITAVLVMMIFNWTAIRLHPVPEGVDMNDPEQRQAFYESLPVLAYLLLIAGSTAGTVVGALGAAFLAKEQIPRMCMTIGAGILVWTLMNLINIHPPVWVMALSVLGVLGAVPVAMSLARKHGFDAPA